MANPTLFKDLTPKMQQIVQRSGWTEGTWNKFGKSDAVAQERFLKGFSAMTSGILNATGNLTGRGPEPERLNVADENLGGIADLASFFEDNAKRVSIAFREMAKDGMFFATESSFQEGLAGAEKSLNKITGIAGLGAQAFKVLSRDIAQFAMLSDKAFQSNGKLSEQLATQAGLLKQLGMSYGSFTSNTDLAINSLNMNAEGVKKFNASIKTLADDLDMLPDTVSRNLQAVAKNLMYDQATIKEQFVKLQVLGQKTGLDPNAIMSRFGQGMDTFAGASGAAANLNALLGGNQFSATQLLGMEEADRAETIRSTIMQNKDLMSDINSGGASGKFAMISVAEALGMGRDEARRFITTGEKDSIKSKRGDQLDAEFGGDANVKVNKFADATVSAAKALKDLTRQFEEIQKPERLPFLLSRRANIEQIGTAGESTMMKQMRQVSRVKAVGSLPGTLSQSQYDKIIQMPGAGQNFQELVKRTQMGLFDEEKLQKLAKQLTDSDDKVREGAIKTANAQRKNLGSVENLLKKAGLSELESSVLSRVAQTSEFGGRILIGEAIRRKKKNKNANLKDLFTSENAETKARSINTALEGLTVEQVEAGDAGTQFESINTAVEKVTGREGAFKLTEGDMRVSAERETLQRLTETESVRARRRVNASGTIVSERNTQTLNINVDGQRVARVEGKLLKVTEEVNKLRSTAGK